MTNTYSRSSHVCVWRFHSVCWQHVTQKVSPVFLFIRVKCFQLHQIQSEQVFTGAITAQQVLQMKGRHKLFIDAFLCLWKLLKKNDCAVSKRTGRHILEIMMKQKQKQIKYWLRVWNKLCTYMLEFVPAVQTRSVGTNKHFFFLCGHFVMLPLFTTTVGFKSSNQDGIKVQAFSICLRVIWRLT